MMFRVINVTSQTSGCASAARDINQSADFSMLSFLIINDCVVGDEE